MTVKPLTAARQAKLQALHEAYAAQLPERLAAIDACRVRLRRGEDSAGQLHALHRLLHSLAGSAGSFGYARLGEQARALELELAPLAREGLPPGPEVLARVEAGLKALQAAGEVQEAAVTVSPATDLPPVEATENNRIIIVEDDLLLAGEIAAQLGLYGWEASIFDNAGQAGAACDATPPAALVVDVALPEGRLAGPDLLQSLRKEHGCSIPAVAISMHWDWESRLAAVRAGADAYFTKPLDFTALAERLGALTHRREANPYRVMVVEDNPLLAAHYTEVLKAAGMEATAVLEPSGLLTALDEFSPELVLMDLYMPGCNGIEAAQVLRQDTKFTGLPIVFLSTESGRKMQQAAMRIGADDFLMKPIADDDLVSAVGLRAERFRALRGLIRQDGMTGLLNHIAFKLQLEHEISRAQRKGTPLTLAMLDIDHFKRVNDRHGHPVGDRVIKSLAQLLRRRMRRTDIVGRYGGEEFGAILPDTGAEAALRVIDGLREQFSRIRHASDGGEFTCTVSAGVAALQPGTGLDGLVQAADAALYEAKHQGRNRVCKV